MLKEILFVLFSLAFQLSFCQDIIEQDSTTYKIYPIQNSNLKKLIIFEIKISADDNIWLVTNKGLIRYSMDHHMEIINLGIPEVEVRVIASDKSNSLWIGTSDDGVLRFENGVVTKKYKFRNSDIEEYGQQPEINNIIIKNNRPFIATNFGVFTIESSYESDTLTRLNINHQLKSAINSICESGETIYFTTNTSINKVNGKNYEVIRKSEIQYKTIVSNSSVVYSIEYIKNESKNANIIMYKDGKWDSIKIDIQCEPMAQNFSKLFFDKINKSIWIISDILLEYKKVSNEEWKMNCYEAGIFNKKTKIHCIDVDKRGVIWLGTSGGLYQLRKIK